MKYVNINDIVKEHDCHECLDKEFDSLMLDKDVCFELTVLKGKNLEIFF